MNTIVGDALPGAVQVFAKALKMTEAELFKAMEQGQLVSSEVLPKVAKAYREAAMEGGAFAMSLKGIAVTQGQLTTQTQKAGDTIFKGGFSEGLSDLFKTLQKSLLGSEKQLKKIGKLFGWVFKIIAAGVKVITPLLQLFMDHIGLITVGLVAMKGAAVAAALSMAAAWTATLAPMIAVIAGLTAISELLGSVDDKTINLLELNRGFQIEDGRKMEIIQRDGQAIRTGKDLGADDSFTSTFFDVMTLKPVTAPIFNKVGEAASSVSNFIEITMNGSASAADKEDVRSMVDQQVRETLTSKGASK